METHYDVILHPNGAVVHRAYSILLNHVGGRFETMVKMQPIRGLEKDTIDCYFSDNKIQINRANVVNSREEADIVYTDSELPVEGKILRVESIGEHVVVRLRKGLYEISHVDVRKYSHAVPDHNLVVNGAVVGMQHPTVSGKLNISYALSSVHSQIHYRLYLPDHVGAFAELRQLLFVENNAGVELGPATVSYNSMPYPFSTAAPQVFRQADMAMAARGIEQADEAPMKTCIIPVGFHTLGQDSLVPLEAFHLKDLRVGFEIFVSLQQRTEEKQATPFIKFPQTDSLVEGGLQIFNMQRQYMTTGRLVLGASSARATLQPMPYGVRVSANSELKPGEDGLSAELKLRVFNSSKSLPLKLYIDYEKALQYGKAHYLREGSGRTKLIATPGSSTQTLKLLFNRIGHKD